MLKYFIPDLRDSTPGTCVPFEEAKKKATEWKMVDYFETSALFNDGIVNAFKQCVSFTAYPIKYSRFCCACFCFVYIDPGYWPF